MRPSELFEKILDKPGMYVSGRSIIQAAAYMSGYIGAQWDLGAYDEKDIYHGFQQWVENRFKLGTTRGWESIVTFMSPDEAYAFEMAKDLWEEYKSQLYSRSP